LIAAPSVPFGSHLGDIDVEIADRVGLELGLDRLFAFDIAQAAYAMALQTAMQGRARQMRQGRLEGGRRRFPPGSD
jgi:hypothetical protein